MFLFLITGTEEVFARVPKARKSQFTQELKRVINKRTGVPIASIKGNWVPVPDTDLNFDLKLHIICGRQHEDVLASLINFLALASKETKQLPSGMTIIDILYVAMEDTYGTAVVGTSHASSILMKANVPVVLAAPTGETVRRPSYAPVKIKEQESDDKKPSKKKGKKGKK